MAIVSIPLAGKLGIVTDLSPAELPPDAWSSGLNARFSHGAVETIPGDYLLQTPPEPIYWGVQAMNDLGAPAVWILGGKSKAYSFCGNHLKDITPAAAQAYTLGLGQTWTGGCLGMYTILHDGVRAPWGRAGVDPETVMEELPHWQAGVSCSALRTFKQYAVALNVTKTNEKFPTMVKWSHPADPGYPPPSWDETDPTKDAGETTLAETPGACVDCVPLRDINVIYKQDSVWGMQYIGGVYVFRFYKIFGDFGMPYRNCAIEYASGKHFVFTGTDLLIHDGNVSKSVIDGRVRKVLASITAEQLPSSYVVAYPGQNEVWFCYRKALEGGPSDHAIVYNYLENTIGLREIPDCHFIATGRIDPKSVDEITWAQQPMSWDEVQGKWGSFYVVPAFSRLLGLGETQLTWLEGGAAVHLPFTLERTYVGLPVRTTVPPDMTISKFLRRLWPRFTGTVGAAVAITFGKANSVAEPITWLPPKTFIVGTSRKLDLTLTGKMFAIRLEVPATVMLPQGLSYSGTDIDLERAGEW